MRWWSCAGLAGIATGAAFVTRTDWIQSPLAELLVGILVGWLTMLLTAPWGIMLTLGRRRADTLRLALRVKQVAQGERMDELDALLLERKDEIGTLSRAVHALAHAKRERMRETSKLKRNMDEKIRKETTKATVRLERAVETDPLTGLGNRRRLDRALAEMVGPQRRREHDQIVALALDLDRFKPINDTLGHEVGDACLVHVGGILKASVRAKDVALRLGGDEFMILLPGESVRTARAIADRLCAQFRQMPWPHQAAERPTLSVGLAAMRSKEVGGGEELMRRADQALYDSKRAGRDRVTIWRAA